MKKIKIQRKAASISHFPSTPCSTKAATQLYITPKFSWVFFFFFRCKQCLKVSIELFQQLRSAFAWGSPTSHSTPVRAYWPAFCCREFQFSRKPLLALLIVSLGPPFPRRTSTCHLPLRPLNTVWTVLDLHSHWLSTWTQDTLVIWVSSFMKDAKHEPHQRHYCNGNFSTT